MTKEQKQNFQQGWLDLLKRHGVTAAIAVFLVYQMSGSFTKQVDALTLKVDAHAEESDRKLQNLIDLMAVVVKGQESDRALMRQQIKYLQLTCLNTARNDEQRRECVK